MKDRIIYIILFFTFLLTEIIIFKGAGNLPFVRNSIGDFLVVMFMYVGVKIVAPSFDALKLVVGILIFSFAIEFLQLVGFPKLFGIEKTWVKIFLGSTFEWLDIMAYVLGVFCIYWIDVNFININSKETKVSI